MNFEVIHAEVQHAPNLAPVFDAYRVWYGAPSNADHAREFLTQRLRNNESQIFIATSGGRIAGFAQLYPLFSSISMESIWLLNDLFVVDEFRRQGVGSLLLQTVAEFAKELGSLRLELATEHHNLAAQSVYESLGWKKDTQFLHYSLPLEVTSEKSTE